MTGLSPGRARFPRLKYGGLIANTSAAWGDSDLSVARLRPPRLRSDLVARTQLVGRILATQQQLVVIRAPAGYGKTVLLAQCAAAARGHVAWLSLDDTDNDPTVLVADLARALREPATLLLLDRADAVHTRPAAAALTSFCEYLPSGCRAVLASRRTPGLPIARLRAERAVLELGVDDVALSRREARQLLHATGVNLDPDAFEALYNRCEGWAAGLYLSTTGRERNVAEYLAAEVVSGASAEQLAFLLATAPLEKFCARLCDAVLERTDSRARIAELEDAIGFLKPIDAQQEWFRYHVLLAETLRTLHSESAAPDASAQHARAAQWYDASGMPADAFRHALAHGDRQHAAELLARNCVAQWEGGQREEVIRWIDALSDTELAQHPPAAAAAAWALGQVGDRARTRRYIRLLEQAPSTGPFPFGETSSQTAVALLKARFGWEGVSQMRTFAERVYRGEAPGSLARARGALLLGAAHLLRGRFEAATPLLEEVALDDQSDVTTAVSALAFLALVHVQVHQTGEAQTVVREALAALDRAGLQPHAAACAVFVACAVVDVERGDFVAARAAQNRALQLLPSVAAAPWSTILLTILCGHVAIELCDLHAAESLLAQAQRDLARFPDAGVLGSWLAREQRALQDMRGGANALSEPLTEAELRVLRLAPTHLTVEGIGRTLCISRNTVKTHLRVIYGKLSVTSRGAAVGRARTLGLLDPDAARV